jgi:hypothetical protein
MLTKQVRELERQANEALANAARVNNRIKISNLKPNYHAFGGKGDVWGDTAHVARSGEYSTMCDRPMLSNNWVRIEGVEHIGCPECLDKYRKAQLTEMIGAAFI